ncbi:MAG: TolC family protein [Porphyromonadaceae bacterium]|nr:TolC family protein [Porphyromonadaceae bacterium]
MKSLTKIIRAIVSKNHSTPKLWSFFLLLLPLLSFSQEKMSLEECLRIGLEQNFDIRLRKNAQQILDNNATPGNSGMLPTVDLSSSFNTTALSGSDQFPADGSEKISTRGSHTETLNAGVNLNWMLFEGFRAQTNYKKLKELQQMGELNTQMTVENFIADLSAEYFKYVQQTIRLKNLRSAVRLSAERLRIVEARYQIGNMSRLDLQQARVDFNTDSSRLINQYEALNSSRIRLNELMGNTDVDRRFSALDTTIQVKEFSDKNVFQDRMYAENILMKLSEKDKKISELDLKSAQSQNFPYLRLNAGYGLTHFNYNRGNFDKQNTWGPNVGLTLGFRIFDGFNKSREQRNAQITIDNRQLEQDQLKLRLNSEFTNIWLAYRNNLEVLAFEKVSLENALLNHEIAMERYKLGDLSGIHLREAQNNLLQAEERLVTAEYNAKLYEISLMQISGRIREYL